MIALYLAGVAAIAVAIVQFLRWRGRRRDLREVETAVGTAAFTVTFSDSTRHKGFDKTEIVARFKDEDVVFIAKTDPVMRVSEIALHYRDKKFLVKGVAQGDLRHPLGRIHRKMMPMIAARKGSVFRR
jgi:hypothetical protein